MAGWLYVISGISFALLGLAAVLPARSLLGIAVNRQPIQPVGAGDQLTIELEIENQTTQPKTLLQVQDVLPFVLGQPVQTAIEIILAQASHRWTYYHPAKTRGVYRWQTVQLRTATPLGLFWCRRRRDVPAKAVVYPQVLPLTTCPLIDEMGQEDRRGDLRGRPLTSATEGLTRSLRPYRQGDPTRLIHWRTSARYGELRVRELEVVNGSQEIIICLDSAATWEQDSFEQAVIAAASLYIYAQRQQMHVKLWTAFTGLVQGERSVMEALAAVNFGEDASYTLPSWPLICLSQSPFINLPTGSRSILWPSQLEGTVNRDLGIVIQADQTLQIQLQKPFR